jgi:hypothetical protein
LACAVGASASARDGVRCWRAGGPGRSRAPPMTAPPAKMPAVHRHHRQAHDHHDLRQADHAQDEPAPIPDAASDSGIRHRNHHFFPFRDPVRTQASIEAVLLRPSRASSRVGLPYGVRLGLPEVSRHHRIFVITSACGAASETPRSPLLLDRPPGGRAARPRRYLPHKPEVISRMGGGP